ncbi:SCO-spondin-like [Ascaphus truei]|uniref:SCO-spondin-like n=1 Tax=Ascaphus truei TaxID=8439 RepID=UPI003F591ECF
MLHKYFSPLLLTFAMSLLLVTSGELLSEPEDFVCGANTQFYYPCKPCPKCCDNRPVTCPERCRPGCSCKPGYVLESRNSPNCITKEQCII